MSFIRPAFKFAPPPATQPVDFQVAVYAPDYFTVGYMFFISNPKIINALGYHNSANNIGTVSAIVSLWDNNQNLIVTTGIATTCTYTQDNFCWITIPAVELPVNSYPSSPYYMIGVTYQADELYVIDLYGTLPTQYLFPASGFDFRGGTFSSTSSELNGGTPALPMQPIFPNLPLRADLNAGFFGPNLSYLPKLANGAYTEYGFKFTASENKTVRGVGVHDVAADGLESNVRVKVEGITNPGNNWTFNVGIGSTLPLVKGYRYKETSAFTLPAGDYRIFAQDTSVIGDGTITNPLFQFTTAPTPSNLLKRDLTLGFQFALVKQKVIDKVAIYYPSGGFQHPHTIKLWATSNPTNPILTVGINSGTYSAVDNFVWIPISPIILSDFSVTSYRIAVFYPGSVASPPDPRVLSQPLADFQLIEPDTLFERGYLGEGDSYPTVLNTTSTANYFGPNISLKDITITPAFKFAPPPATQPVEKNQALYAPDYATFGYMFAIDTPKIINALGYYRSQTGVGTLNAIVSIWDQTGVMLATTGIASTCTYSQDNFCWITIPAIELPATPQNPSFSSWYVIGVTYQAEELYVIDSYGTLPTQNLSSAPEFNYLGGLYSSSSSDLNDGTPVLPMQPIYPDILLSDQYNQGYFGPNISYINTNPLKIAKNTSTVSEVSGILYTNNIKRNPLTTGITTITADGNAYFGPVLFVEVYS